MATVTWTDTPIGSAAHVDGVLICQIRKLGVGGWSAGWRNGMKWDVNDQLSQVAKQTSRHFGRRDLAKRAVEKSLAAACASADAKFSAQVLSRKAGHAGAPGSAAR